MKNHKNTFKDIFEYYNMKKEKYQFASEKNVEKGDYLVIPYNGGTKASKIVIVKEGKVTICNPHVYSQEIDDSIIIKREGNRFIALLGENQLEKILKQERKKLE